jgi:hypothetical protein
VAKRSNFLECFQKAREIRYNIDGRKLFFARSRLVAFRPRSDLGRLRWRVYSVDVSVAVFDYQAVGFKWVEPINVPICPESGPFPVS